jgi:DNA invertase Pin-like site-specific DNA recombinase
MLQAAIYAYQADPAGDRLTEQVQQCRAYCEQKGLPAVAIYQEKSTREELQRLLTDAGTGAFQVVVVSEGIRFSRTLSKLVLIVHQLETKGITVLQAQEK